MAEGVGEQSIQPVSQSRSNKVVVGANEAAARALSMLFLFNIHMRQRCVLLLLLVLSLSLFTSSLFALDAVILDGKHQGLATSTQLLSTEFCVCVFFFSLQHIASSHLITMGCFSERMILLRI